MSMTTAFTTPSISTSKWRWLCLALAWVATLGAVVSPLVNIAATLLPDTLGHLLHQTIQIRKAMPITGAVPLPYRVGILACDSLSIGFGMWAFWSMRQLFLGFARGEVFTATALRHLNHIALALLLSEVADLLMQGPETLLASWVLGPGKRAIELGLGTDDFSNLFLAGVAFIIARVMAEARRIADENASIV